MLKAEFIDTEEGLRECTSIPINLDVGETKSFIEFTQKAHQLLARLRIQQNQWHIPVIEALVGDGQPSLSKRLAIRLSRILAKTDREKKALKQLFVQLYQFGCDLVHGNIPKNETWLGHLREARTLARRTLLWFLRFLAEVQQDLALDAPTDRIPTRKDILTLIDLNRIDRNRLRGLISKLTDEFPLVAEWDEVY